MDFAYNFKIIIVIDSEQSKDFWFYNDEPVNMTLDNE